MNLNSCYNDRIMFCDINKGAGQIKPGDPLQSLKTNEEKSYEQSGEGRELQNCFRSSKVNSSGIDKNRPVIQGMYIVSILKTELPILSTLIKFVFRAVKCASRSNGSFFRFLLPEQLMANSRLVRRGDICGE